MLTEIFKHSSDDLIQRGLHRKRAVINVQSPGGINFSSNDYLSLSSHPLIKKAYQEGFERYSCGSGGSMVVCGYHSSHEALERAFAEALGVDDCLVFPSGYAANLSIMGLLARFNTHVLIDKAVHASIYDGLTLSGAQYSRYLHNNLSHVAQKLESAPLNTAMVTEGTFSMSGQCAPLGDLVDMAKNHGHTVLVDEAHSFGLLGREGLGAVAHYQLTQEDVPLRMIAFGKACASFGAIVAGRAEWIDALLQSARAHIYSTAISPAVAHGLLKTLDIVRHSDERRRKLTGLVHYFRESIKASPLRWSDSSSPIQQLQLGCPERALLMAERLQEHAIVCLPMREPTVSRVETGLRVILNHDHEQEDIDRLFQCLDLA